MSKPVIQGWCPGALRPMVSGDGFVVRVRPRLGRLTQDEAKGIARLAMQHGNGLIDFSARANLQLRGVTQSSHPALIDGLRELGLIDETVEAETRRNIIVTPFWTEADPTQSLVADLSRALAAANALALPGKFGFALDTAGAPALRDVAADIWLETGPDGLLLATLDGLAKPVCVDTAVAEAIALAHWFIETGGVTAGRGRMAAHLAFRALPPGFVARRLAATPAPQPGPNAIGQLVGLEFGQIGAETLFALGDLGALRVTPWRLLMIEGLNSAPNLPGIITSADDPMLRLVACTGAPGCLQAHAETRSIARALAPYQTQLLHVSGCAKGCAHPGAAPLTLTATTEGFSLIRDGSASGVSTWQPLSAKALIENPALLTELT